MVRLASDARTDDEDKPLRMKWDGTEKTAREIVVWAMNGDLITRFMWNAALHAPDEARTLVERPFPDSSEWLLTPVGTVIVRQGRSDDAPLRLIPPLPNPAPEPDPIKVLEEQ